MQVIMHRVNKRLIRQPHRTTPVMPRVTVKSAECHAVRNDIRRWTTAAGTSLTTHALGFAAFAASWMWWGEAEDRATFTGRDRAMTIEAAWSEPVPETVVIEETEAPVPVEVSPLEARIEKHRFTETRQATTTLAVVDFPAESTAPRVQAEKSELGESAAAVEPTSAEREPAPTLPRRTLAKPPASVASVAMPAQVMGTDDTQPPSFVRNRPPRYPELARQRGWQGTVLLRLSINESGQVTDVEIARTSGYELLDAEAVTTVRQWQAAPARRRGRPVSMDVYLPVRFVL